MRTTPGTCNRERRLERFCGTTPQPASCATPTRDMQKRCIARGEHAHVVSDGDCLRLNREAGQRAPPPFGEHVVEQYRVDPAEQQVRVRMDVIVVRNRLEAVVALRVLEVMRDLDLPQEILEDEDPTRTLPRRFGLSDVVDRQIRTYRDDVRRRVRLADAEVEIRERMRI